MKTPRLIVGFLLFIDKNINHHYLKRIESLNSLWYVIYVVQNIGKKWLYILFFTYLIFALMGSLALSINKTFDFDTLNKNNVNSDVYFTKLNLAVDWLAENTNTIRKAHRNSSFQLHSGLVSIFMLAGIFFTVFCINKSIFLLIKDRQTTDTRKTVLLKLRI